MKREFELKAPLDTSAAISDIAFDHQYIDVQTARSSQNTRDRVVAVSLKPDVPYGDFKTILSFKLEGAPQPLKEVTVRGRVLSPVEVRPHSLVIVRGGPSADEYPTVEFASPYGDALELVSVEATPKGLLSLDAPPPNTGHTNVRLHVRAVGSFEKGLTSGALKAVVRVGDKVSNVSAEWHVWSQ